MAASLVPSADEVIPYQTFIEDIDVSVTSVQVVPESLEIQMLPPTVALYDSTAASLVPSADEVTSLQCFVDPTDVSSIQVSKCCQPGTPHLL
jgi:hypothetical protein